MKRNKLLTSIFLLIVSVICFAGCAKIEMFRTVDARYNIVDKYVITLDKNKLGNNYTNVREAIYEDMVTFRNYVNGWIDSFHENYPDVYTDLVEGIKCQEVKKPDDGNSSKNELSISIEFKDTYCFGVFYGIVQLEDGEYEKAMGDIGPFVSQMLNQEYKTEGMGIFFYKYSMINNANFFDNITKFKVDGIDTNYYEKYSNLAHNYKLSDIELSQVFVYPDDRIYSNADYKEVVDGYTFLGWDLSNKQAGFEMSIYKLTPKVIAWYISGLAISVVAIVVLFIVLKKKQGKTIQIKITKKEAEKDER